MYRNIFVPIDGSPLSSATVDQAVAYARSSGARLTFFHARPDYGATGDGAMMRSAAPEVFAESAAGNARALLAKAEVAARSAGVEFTSCLTTSDRPHEAILDGANEQACDLIFMASHGRRGLKGMLLGSVTQKVLQRATLPVLVAAVESNLQISNEQRAVATIKDEHRSLSAAIHGLQEVLHQSKVNAQVPDFALLRAMLFYIENFPERLHHPKEEIYLFRKLSERTHECDALIAELRGQHVEGASKFAALRSALANFELNPTEHAEAFAAAIDSFASAQWQHIGAEEKLLLPAASRHLTTADWAEIASAFHDNADPSFGIEADEPFNHLFSRILNLQA